VSDFERVIGRVWRRMRAQRFLSALVWCLAVGLFAAAVALGVDKLPGVRMPVEGWVPFAAAGSLAVVVAALIALLTGPSRLDAAIAIDRAFHLNDRLGTVLGLPEDLRETAAGRALMADTRKQLEAVDVRTQFGLKLPRRAWVTVIPALLAVGLLFVPEFTTKKAQAEELKAELNAEEVSKQAKALNKRIAETKKKLEESDALESTKLLAQIEKAAEELAKAAPKEKERALVEMNKLTDALKERQKQVGDMDQISKKLQQLKEMSSEGPADEFAKDLAKGDFQKAASEIQKLKDQLAKGKMSEEGKKQLQEQLSEMKKQLEQLANLEERKKQLEEAKKAGAISQEQFDQKMAALNDQAEDLKKLQQLADKLANAQQQMSQGDMQKAAQALGTTQEQLEQMASEMAEMENLDMAMADLQAAKDGMTGGEGLNQIGDRLGGMNGMGQGMGQGNNNGQGLGQGRGAGDRPIAPDSTSAYNTKVAQQLGKGKAIQEGFGPPGGQTIGESVIEAQAEMEAGGGVTAEALTNQKVPATIKKHVLGYFDEFRKDQEGTAPPPK
jgi:hypothetical protein